MALATFDGPNKLIQIPSTGTFDAQRDLYSAWKAWAVQGSNIIYAPAFDTIGGDDVGSGQRVAPYYFVRNDLGWRIRAPEANGEIVISGNIFPRAPLTTYIIQASGFDALIRLEVSTRAVLLETGTSGLTSEEANRLTALEDQLTEVHSRLGLNATEPVTHTPDQITFGSVTITMSGDPLSSLVATRS